jgi:GNAT superfamily N-acetyltransferase
MIGSRITVFPEGSIVAEYDGSIVGYVSGVIISSEAAKRWSTWYDYTDNGTARGVFDPDGDILFGISLTVDDECRGQGIGTGLLIQIARMAIENNLCAGILGGRLPSYHERSHLSPEEYIALKDEQGRVFDPELRLYLRQGLRIREVRPGYFRDPDSLDYGVILEWKNPFYGFTRFVPVMARPLSLLFRL